MNDVEAHEKSKLIKEALKIVDELSKYDFDDMDDYEKEKLETLIEKAKKITKSRHWKLT
jgi:hypothetical protein